MDAWEIPADNQNQIIQHLLKEKFIDEERYCKAFVNDKSKYNHWGINKIRFELKKKQIPESMIREALKKLDPEENRDRLALLIEKKRKSVKGKNEWEIRQKLLRYAASKGFSKAEIELILVKSDD
jgi:regulatory protein